MKNTASKLASIVTLLLLVPFVVGIAQTNVTELEVTSILDVAFDVTVTYDDNTIETQTVPIEGSVVFVALVGRHIISLEAGVKVVNIPMAPSPQTGWGISGTQAGQTVQAHYCEISGGDACGWGSATIQTTSDVWGCGNTCDKYGMLFSY